MSFRYICRNCGKTATVKLYDVPPPSPALQLFTPGRLDELITSATGPRSQRPDAYQSAWVAVLYGKVQTEADVVALARRASRQQTHRKIEESKIILPLSRPISRNDPNFTIEDVLASPDPDIDARLDAAAADHRPSLVARITSAPDGISGIDLSKVSPTELARTVGCAVGSARRALSREPKSLPSLPLAFDIAKALHVSMDSLYAAITGSDGVNPPRINGPSQRIGRFKEGSRSWREQTPLPPKYTVNGKGFPNLRMALLALGIDRHAPTHFDKLPEDVKMKITRNRLCRGR